MKFNLNQENINYIKIICKDNNGFAHCLKAAVKTISESEIYSCTKFEEKLLIPYPQNVNLSIVCDNGLYKSETVLKYIQKEESYLYIALKTPKEVEYQQKREYFRIKLNENALITYEKNNEMIKIPAETFDMSANGVRLMLDNKTDFPEDVKITLYLPKKNIVTNAKFIRVDDEEKLIKASFQFIDLKEQDLDYISQVCLSKQLEERRKLLMN